MNYSILSIDSKANITLGKDGCQTEKDVLFFTTDRTIGRDPDVLCPLIGVEKERFARPHQTHEDHILRIEESFFRLSEADREAQMEGIDAVISDVSNCCLGISTADCIPVLVYDREHHAAAAIHAGWRGTRQRIVTKAMAAMQEAFGTQPQHCEATIGPGISLASFEVGNEVYDAFANDGFPMEGIAERYPNGKWHLDLKEINRRLLVDSGIPASSITVSDIDTMTDQRFFSARREQKGDEKCGRILSGFVAPPPAPPLGGE